MGVASPSFELVVSSDNVATLAWQCAVFDYTCRKHGTKRPLIVVHGDPAVPLQEHYKGLRVLRAPSEYGRFGYKPRNTQASLFAATQTVEADYYVLCDPDLVLVQPFSLPVIKGGASSCHSGILKWDSEPVAAALKRWGLTVEEMEARQDLNCCVPHVIHRDHAAEVAAKWLPVVDTILAEGMKDKSGRSGWHGAPYIASMYGFGIAAVLLNLTHAKHHLSLINSNRALRSATQMVHYAQPIQGWFKRSWYPGKQTAAGAAKRLDPEAPIPEPSSVPEGSRNRAVLDAIWEWAEEAGVSLA